MTDDRPLIFSNLLNGVPVWQVARDFHRTEAEVMLIFSFILRKIKSYCFLRQARRAYPTILASTVEEARRHRVTCLSILPFLNLDKDPQYKDIQSEVVTPDNMINVARNLTA